VDDAGSGVDNCRVLLLWQLDEQAGGVAAVELGGAMNWRQ
jgi:hypothetical protein